MLIRPQQALPLARNNSKPLIFNNTLKYKSYKHYKKIYIRKKKTIHTFFSCFTFFSMPSYLTRCRGSNLALSHWVKERKTPSLSAQANFAPFSLKVAWSGKYLICPPLICGKLMIIPCTHSYLFSIDKWTGVVTTTRLTHASPAQTYGAAADRGWECDADQPDSERACKDLARQLVEEHDYIRVGYSPGHTLRCCTPAMGRSEGAAMPQNRVRCAAIKSSTCSIFCS